MGYRPQGCKESDMTERQSHTHLKLASGLEYKILECDSSGCKSQVSWLPYNSRQVNELSCVSVVSPIG